MNLSDRIVKKYPMSMGFITSAPQNVFLSYEDTVLAAQQMALEAALQQDMSVVLVRQEGHKVIKIHIDTVKAGDILLRRIQSKDEIYYFDPKTAVKDMPWIVRAMADNAAWRKKCQGSIVKIKIYSAKQQLLALRFIRECQRQQDANGNVTAPSDMVVEAIREIADKHMEQRLPNYCDRPVTEKGWELIRESNGLFGRKQQMTLNELSLALYGELDLNGEVQDWIDFYCSQDAYLKEQERITNKICNILRRSCRLGVGERVLDHVRARLNAEEEEAFDQKERLAAAFEREIEVRKVHPEMLTLAFNEVTVWFNRILQTSMAKRTSQQLLDSCDKQMRAELSGSRSKIQEHLRDLQSFCPMEEAGRQSDMQINWPQLAELDDNLIVTSISGWDSESFDELYMSVPDRHNVVAWLMPENMRKMMQHTSGFADIQSADLNSGDTAVAVYGEPLPDGGARYE